MSAETLKRAAGEAGAALVEPGMVVGLGTGSTAACFIEALARRRLDIRCVATSRASETLARSLGLEVVEPKLVEAIDLTIDGADEIGPGLALIKGGGAALLREKLVWTASRRCVVIADESKRVERLGRFALPIEIVSFGARWTLARVEAAAAAAGAPGDVSVRRSGAEPARTDQGNLIADLACGAIADPAGPGGGAQGRDRRRRARALSRARRARAGGGGWRRRDRFTLELSAPGADFPAAGAARPPPFADGPEANSTARQVASGFLAHHRCSVEGCPRRSTSPAPTRR